MSHQTLLASILVAMAVLLAPAKEAAAEDLVVFEAENVAYTPGDVVDGSDPVQLEPGQSLSLITPDGKVLKLTGPYDQAPVSADGGEGPGVVDALKGLMKDQGADVASLGVTRDAFSGDGMPALPSPWVVHAQTPGDWCVRSKDTVVFWRRNEAAESAFTMKTLDRRWQAETTWPAGYGKLAAPPDAPIEDGSTFVVEADGKEAMLTFHKLPGSLNQVKALAAWMAQKNCTLQAKTLLSSAE